MEKMEKDQERRGPSLWMGLVVFLTISVIVGGFLGAFYMFKQNAHDHTNQLVEFLSASRQRQEEIINYNIKQQNTRNEEKGEEKEQRIYHDNEKGLTVLVDEKSGACLLYPPNFDDLQDEVLQSYLAQHPYVKGQNDTEVQLKPHKEGIENTSILGQKIADMCEDKRAFWLYPTQQEEAHQNDGKLLRPKRSHRRSSRRRWWRSGYRRRR